MTATYLLMAFLAVVAIGSTLALISDSLERWWNQ